MTKDRFYKVEKEAVRTNDEFWLDSIRFFRNANEVAPAISHEAER